jgi:hypothetical protein
MKPISNYTEYAVTLIVSLVIAVCALAIGEDKIPLIELDNVPLVDVIRTLAHQSDLNYVLDPHVPGSTFGPGRLVPSPKITARWTNLSAQTALSTLLHNYKLTMVTNPVTSVMRIVPADLMVKPVSAQPISTNANQLIPLLVFDAIPLIEAITNLANAANLKVSFDPKVSAPEFSGQGTVSVRWQRITVGQALAALLDNYGLVMAEEAATSSVRIARKTIADPEKEHR